VAAEDGGPVTGGITVALLGVNNEHWADHPPETVPDTRSTERNLSGPPLTQALCALASMIWSDPDPGNVVRF
jgi:hypothetical protein